MDEQIGFMSDIQWCTAGSSNLFRVIVHHAGRVIDSQADLIVSLTGFGPPQPDLIFTELTCNVGYHLPHVQAFPCAVIPSGKR